MLWRAIVLMVAAMAALPSASAAPYLMEGYDAARTGNTPDPGPERMDVAMKLQLPGWVPDNTAEVTPPPVILDGTVYALVHEHSGDLGDPAGSPPPHLNTTGIVRIDLATAEVTVHVPLEEERGDQWFASDGERFFVTGNDDVTAYAVEDGREIWSQPHPVVVPTGPRVNNCRLTIDQGVVYTACNQYWAYQGGPEGVPSAERVVQDTDTTFAVAYDAEDGAPLWPAPWVADADPTRFGDDPAGRMNYEGTLPGIKDVLVTGETVVVHSLGVNDPLRGAFLWGLARTDGEGLWAHAWEERDGQDGVLGVVLNPGFQPAVAATDSEVLWMTSEFRAIDPATGAERWAWVPPSVVPDVQEAVRLDFRLGGSLLAVSEDAVFAAFGQTLHRLRPTGGTPEETWATGLGDSEWFGGRGLILSGAGVYGTTLYPEPALHVFDATSGTTRATVPIPYETVDDECDVGFEEFDFADAAEVCQEVPVLAVGEGVLVVVNAEGIARVFGSTPASIGIDLGGFDAYPSPGERVRLDLSGTRPGVQGDDVEFRVSWGDDDVDDWQASPIFEHAYAQAVIHEAVVEARNAAGQTSSAIALFDVGGSPPKELNWAQQAFEPENYDLTFGILGIILAVGGGLFALLRTRRRRGRLDRELAAIDAAAEPVHDNPTRLAAAMDERRAHCHGLLVDHQIDESQHAVLEKHIEAVARGGRMHQMRELFDFLPHGMVVALEEMLADGRITAWEREGFQGVLDRNDVLTTNQKRKVSGLIDAWFKQDEGSA